MARIGEPEHAEFKFTCLKCGKELDGFMVVNSGKVKPKPGDVSLCIYCQNLAMFTETGIRPPTAEEWEIINADKQLQQAVQTAREMHKPWRLVTYRY